MHRAGCTPSLPDTCVKLPTQHMVQTHTHGRPRSSARANAHTRVHTPSWQPASTPPQMPTLSGRVGCLAAPSRHRVTGIPPAFESGLEKASGPRICSHPSVGQRAETHVLKLSPRPCHTRGSDSPSPGLLFSPSHPSPVTPRDGPKRRTGKSIHRDGGLKCGCWDYLRPHRPVVSSRKGERHGCLWRNGMRTCSPDFACVHWGQNLLPEDQMLFMELHRSDPLGERGHLSLYLNFPRTWALSPPGSV